MRVARLISVLVVLAGVPLAADTQPANGSAGAAPHQVLPGQNGGSTEASPLDLGMQLRSLTHAAISLPLAAVLGAALAFRPRRRGTPPRSSPVIHTQMILAIVGAMVMLIVGASLARAFGIVGAASLVRYRAKIDDPKDAGVMLSTLALGLACGVGLYLLAVFGTVFVLGFLWLIESFEPVRRKTFMLRVATKEPAALRPAVEQMLRRQRVPFELRTSSADEVSYEVLLPYEQPTDRLSNAILALDERGETAVEWEEKKAK